MITVIVNDTELDFEHSLVSLSDWEAEFEKPFYPHKDDEHKTNEELLRYFEFMYIGPREHRSLVSQMNDEQQMAVVQYIMQSRTATTIREVQQSRNSRENVTSELIYYWLVALQIPFKPTDEWHLNRLMMLVKVVSAKQAPPKKDRRSRAERAQSMRDINEQRRRQLGTRG